MKLGDICKFQSGGTPSKNESAYFNGNIPWITTVALNGDYITDSDAVDWITEKAIKESAAKIVPENSIMVGTRVGVGKVGINKIPMSTSQDIISLLGINECEWYKPYLCKYLQSKSAYLNSQARGATIKGIKIDVLASLEISELSIEEQKNISFLFDTLTSLISLRKQQLAKLDELVKARFVELFGDPVANEKGWDTKPLLEMGSCKNGMNFHYEDKGVELNCLGVGDFKDYSTISDTSVLPTISLNEMPSDDYMLKDNDIVFVRSNGNKALVGRSVAVYPGKVPTTFSGFCIRYRKTDDIVSIPYLLRVLKSESVRQKMAGRGANIQNLNQQILGTLIIPVPPIELQNEFATFVEQTDKSKSAIQQSLDKLETLKRALMQKYFG